LEYHSARYYAPWLGRWLSCDPLFTKTKAASHDAETGKEQKKIRDPYSDKRVENDNADGDKSASQQKRENGDPEKADEHLQKSQQQINPGNSRENNMSKQEEVAELKKLNLYAYANGNPIIYQDPTGELGVLQAWWDGYNTSGTAGKVGFGFLFIFAWLAHVLINVIILILSVTLFNLGGLFGAWDFSFGALQSSLGLAIGLFTILLGADVRPHWGMGAEIEMPAYMSFYKGYGVSFGPFTFGGPGFTKWKHEAGHTWQSRVLGPFYLFIIGIPSAAGASWTEKWANSWAT